jgi:hypothetical protein
MRAMAKIGAAAAFGEAVQVESKARHQRYALRHSLAPRAFLCRNVAAAIQDGKLDVTQPVVQYVPELGTNGKDAASVEQPSISAASRCLMRANGFDRAARIRRLKVAPCNPPAEKE